MLNALRKNTKLIIWIVVLSFVLWGAFSVGTQFEKRGRVAGEVFGKDITFQEFNRFYKSQLIFSVNGQKPQSADQAKDQAWQSLIYSKEAKRLKIEVSDDEVRAEVHRLLAEQKMADISVDEYRKWLKNSIQSSPDEFESQIRELLRVRKLIEKVKSGQKIQPATDKEALEQFKLEQNQLSGEIVKFKTEEEARTFANAAKTAETWTRQLEAQKLKAEPTGLITLLAWFTQLHFGENDMNILLNAETGSIHGPMKTGQEFSAVKVLEKKLTPEEDFEKSFKEKYLEEIAGRKSYQSFLSWHVDLLGRAMMKDYMPGADQPENAPPQQAA